jgi:hypothetical protein
LNKTQKFEDLVKDLSLKYENKYEYSQIEGKEYINKKSKIIIKCPSHGDFIKTAQKHLLGQDCFKCKIEKLVNTGVLVGGYSFELFEKNPDLKRKDSYLYYLEINDGELYKIGITINDVKNRIKSIKSHKRCIQINYVRHIYNLVMGIAGQISKANFIKRNY